VLDVDLDAAVSAIGGRRRMSSSSSQSRKRPAPQPVQHDAGGSVSGGSSRTSSQRVRKRKAVSRAFDGLAIHVVDDKLTSEEMTAFWHLIESHCGRVVGRETADVIATKLHRPARIAAHLPEPLDSRVVVRTDWITDSALAGERRPYEPYLLPTGTARPQTLVALPSTAGAMAPPPKPSLIKRTAATSATAIEPPAWTNEKWACQRWAPLVCPNQRLVDELRVIKEQRNLTSASRDDKSSFIACAQSCC
jgi:DNA polymerase mu